MRQIDIIFRLLTEAVNYHKSATGLKCHELQAFAVLGSMHDLDADSLGKNIFYQNTPFFFSKAWRALKYNPSRLEFDYPIMVAYETSQTYDEVFTRDSYRIKYEIQVAVLDKLPREAAEIQGPCGSRTKEQVFIDTEAMLLNGLSYLNDIVVINELPSMATRYLHKARLQSLTIDYKVNDALTNTFHKMIRQLNPSIRGQRFEGGKNELLGSYATLSFSFTNCFSTEWDFEQPDYGVTYDKFEKFVNADPVP